MNVDCVETRRGVAVIGTVIGILAATMAVQPIDAGPRGADMKVHATVKRPEIIAVRIRHDICPLCKQIDPEFPKIVGEAQAADILFVTLDLSNEATQQQAALLVGALGLERLWTGDLSKVGSVTFVDGTSRQTLSFVQSVEAGAIRTAMNKAVAAKRH